MTTETIKEPAVNLKGRPIVQIGLVVGDATQVGKHYAELFGIGPWRFLETSYPPR